MPRKRRKKDAKEAPHLALCGRCEKVSATLDGGVCAPCGLKIKAEAAAPPPPPEPEPIPEVNQTTFLGAHPGCFRCERVGPWKICPSCTSALFGVPGNKEGDPVLKYPKPLSAAGW